MTEPLESRSRIKLRQGELSSEQHFFAVVSTVFLSGLVLWGLMLWLTIGHEKPNDLLIHLGKSGATLAVIAVLGGVVKAAFEKHEEMRQKKKDTHDFYRNCLADFKSVYDRVESCRLLVEAHQSAKTYGEQARSLVGGVVTLHNVKRALDPEFPRLKGELDESISKMTDFIMLLLNEFRDNYKRIANLQSADEAWNKHLRDDKLPKEGVESYDPVSRAWEEIQALPELGKLRNRFEEYNDSFLNHLDHASETLRMRLPVEKEAQRVQ